nr:MAG TPA: hypothetical protein [Caudoviricetes sp.]
MLGFFNFVDVNKIGSHTRLWYNSCCKSVKVLLDRQCVGWRVHVKLNTAGLLCRTSVS